MATPCSHHDVIPRKLTPYLPNNPPLPFKLLFFPHSQHTPHSNQLIAPTLNLVSPTPQNHTPHTLNMFRTQLVRQARLFSTSPIARKSPVETVRDAAKAVDAKISGAAVKGIEKGGTYSSPLFLPHSNHHCSWVAHARPFLLLRICIS